MSVGSSQLSESELPASLSLPTTPSLLLHSISFVVPLRPMASPPIPRIPLVRSLDNAPLPPPRLATPPDSLCSLFQSLAWDILFIIGHIGRILFLLVWHSGCLLKESATTGTINGLIHGMGIALNVGPVQPPPLRHVTAFEMVRPPPPPAPPVAPLPDVRSPVASTSALPPPVPVHAEVGPEIPPPTPPSSPGPDAPSPIVFARGLLFNHVEVIPNAGNTIEISDSDSDSIRMNTSIAKKLVPMDKPEYRVLAFPEKLSKTGIHTWGTWVKRPFYSGITQGRQLVVTGHLMTGRRTVTAVAVASHGHFGIWQPVAVASHEEFWKKSSRDWTLELYIYSCSSLGFKPGCRDYPNLWH
ncbi:hypothetical protein SISNIDRAFT_464015 [Sistotremastrum niveocremeum HHB9708]|uniref:Uncharacterized protein n=1 Tax=Sistotremastrum niveocremeum HHB9708 TaxID=1314777 RepID=A0A164Y3M3_9AGAM|nr:hypothetical protein SISNIDRAFT_464015 [Sistotremastrum niveocremeum HHB9708]